MKKSYLAWFLRHDGLCDNKNANNKQRNKRNATTQQTTPFAVNETTTNF
jgi:hypothetical protein